MMANQLKNNEKTVVHIVSPVRFMLVETLLAHLQL